MFHDANAEDADNDPITPVRCCRCTFDAHFDNGHVAGAFGAILARSTTSNRFLKPCFGRGGSWSPALFLFDRTLLTVCDEIIPVLSHACRFSPVVLHLRSLFWRAGIESLRMQSLPSS